MLKRILLSTILLAAAPLAAYADNFDYTYVEGAYTSVSPQHGNTTSLTITGMKEKARASTRPKKRMRNGS